jgi:hypothetical protein
MPKKGRIESELRKIGEWTGKDIPKRFLSDPLPGLPKKGEPAGKTRVSRKKKEMSAAKRREEFKKGLVKGSFDPVSKITPYESELWSRRKAM